MNDQERLKKYELRNIAQCDRIAILEAQNKQQADRIAELEKQLNDANTLLTVNKLQNLTNTVPQEKQSEPVAWIKQGKYGSPTLIWDDMTKISYNSNVVKQDFIPLFLSPQTKPLSDEEIDHEPVAWTDYGGGFVDYGDDPNYPHPLYSFETYCDLVYKSLKPQTKPLSDEEITQVALKIGLIVEEQLTEDYAHDYVAEQIEFARAIESKVREEK